MVAPQELSIDQLRRRVDPDQFDFETTADLPPLEEIIGQNRAVEAVAFGMGMPSPGYNTYALGPPGTGRTTTVRKYLERESAKQQTPNDWCYVNNFENSDKPNALQLPAGWGRQFQDDMAELIEDLKTAIARVFESEDYQQQREQVTEELHQRRRERLQDLEDEAEKHGFTLMRTPAGLVVAPVRDGEVLGQEEFRKLDPETRQEIEKARTELQDKLEDAVSEIQDMERGVRQQIEELDRRVASFAVGHLIDDLKEKYEELAHVVEYLDAVQQDILENVDDFKEGDQDQQQQMMQMMGMRMPQRDSSFERYQVNLLVDNDEVEGAPVVFETNPHYHNLVGRIEHKAQFGALTTNFTMLKAGALHRANGGYLVVEIEEILTNPFAWDALKRALKNKEIKMEQMGEEFRFITTVSVEPEPIPLDVKIVLIGNPLLYYLLHALDEDFQELFKVKADFALEMDWTPETVEEYAQFMGTCITEEELRHFERGAVAKVVEQSARMVADKKKLSVRFGDVVDLMREASYWAGQNGNDFVAADDVQKGIDHKVYRSNRIEERIRELIDDGTIKIDVDGQVEGQVNGLSILSLGDYAFGKPSRITVRTHMGSGGVVDIERETDMSGPIHSKGVMILSGYLGGKYAQDKPLSLSASIAFEQSYEEIEGDSASSTELYALLSSLSGYPLSQGIAVTGSVNQHGEVQAIGGVNHKIEGYFDVCKIKGLTGGQGVMIPQENVQNLMLREDVVAAVAEGQFHIYPVQSIDEGIEILTGEEAGELQEDGTYPEDTVNWAVNEKLEELARELKQFGKDQEESEGEGGE